MEQVEEVDYHIYKEFEIIDKVGKGTYGVVYKARHKRTQQLIAIKKIIDAFQNPIDAKRTYRELNYLLQLTHPNVILLQRILPHQRRGQARLPNTSRLTVAALSTEEQRGSTTDKLLPNRTAERHLYAVFELMDTDLSRVLKQCEGMQSIQRKYIAYQMMQGVAYLHQSGLIHRDIKPSNLLVNCQSLETKICDFGMARLKSQHKGVEDGVLTEYVASRWYRPPQILLGINTCQEGIDLWSAGCVIAELVLKQPIFPGKNTLDQLQLIFKSIGMPSVDQVRDMQCESAQLVINNFTFSKRCKYRSLRETLSMADSAQIDLIERLLQFNPSNRISANQALEHPYFNQVRHHFSSNKSEPARIAEHPYCKDRSSIPEVEHYRGLVGQLQKYGGRSTNRSLPIIAQFNRQAIMKQDQPEKEKSTKESGCVQLMNTILEERRAIKTKKTEPKKKEKQEKELAIHSVTRLKSKEKGIKKDSVRKSLSLNRNKRPSKTVESISQTMSQIKSPKKRSNTLPEKVEPKNKSNHRSRSQGEKKKPRSQKLMEKKEKAVKTETREVIKKMTNPSKGGKALLTKHSSKKVGMSFNRKA